MLTRFLLVACILVIAMGVVLVPFPDGLVAIGMVFVLSAGFVLIFRHYTDEKPFVTTVYLVGLAARMGFGLLIYIFEGNEFFGGDSLAYDRTGQQLVAFWMGLLNPERPIVQIDPTSGVAWGMYYLVGGIYYVLGHNFFAAQSFVAVFGAATAVLIYFLAGQIYSNSRVAKFAAISVAIFPSFVIWSGQLLKDGLIIFLLVLIMVMVLRLQQKMSYLAVAVLTVAMFGILSLRFYIFYMVAVAVACSFIVGLSSSAKALLRNTVILTVVGMGLTYLGVANRASVEISTFGSLERVQESRQDLARAANSGFGNEMDVSTTEGALSAIPVGFAYLMFAPFPWQAANLRQAITIPEVLAWWAMIPLAVFGCFYTIRNKLRAAFPVLIFASMLTVAYSVFQGNVGTAYRQRTQIQVFLFLFVAAGWTLYREHQENKRLLRLASHRELESQLRGRALTARNA
jgi:hypothetical protein